MFCWSNETNLWLFTVEEFNKLPDGIKLESIDGNTLIKSEDYINMDIRYGYTAYGVRDPNKHPEAELFLTFMLKQ